MKVEGVYDGAPRLVVMVIDRHCGEAASHLPFLKHVDLDLRAKVLPQEVCRGAASDTGPDNRWAERDTVLVFTFNNNYLYTVWKGGTECLKTWLE